MNGFISSSVTVTVAYSCTWENSISEEIYIPRVYVDGDEGRGFVSLRGQVIVIFKLCVI